MSLLGLWLGLHLSNMNVLLGRHVLRGELKGHKQAYLASSICFNFPQRIHRIEHLENFVEEEANPNPLRWRGCIIGRHFGKKPISLLLNENKHEFEGVMEWPPTPPPIKVPFIALAWTTLIFDVVTLYFGMKSIDNCNVSSRDPLHCFTYWEFNAHPTYYRKKSFVLALVNTHVTQDKHICGRLMQLPSDRGDFGHNRLRS